MFDASADRLTRRNVRLGVLNGALFNLAEALIDPTLVFVVFVSQLTRSPVLIGLIVPLRNAGWFLPQLWVSGIVQSWPRKMPLYKWMAIIRVAAWGAMVAGVFLIRAPAWLLAVTYVLYTGLEFASGVSGLSFMDVVGKVVPPRRRGEFFAWRMSLGGLLGVGAGLFIRWALDPARSLPFPHDFGIVFAASFFAGAVALLAFTLVVEPPEQNALPSSASFRNQLRSARRLLAEDPNYRKFLRMRTALMVAGAATPFFVVHFQDAYRIPTEIVGLYLAAYTASSLVATAVLGRLSSRLGNRRTMGVASAAGMGMVAVVLGFGLLTRFLPVSSYAAGLALIPVFILSGVREGGIGIAAGSLLLDLAPPGQRPLYLGFTHTVLGGVLLATAASGLVVQWLGSDTLFTIALGANLVAMLYARHMSEPQIEPALMAPAEERLQA